MWNLILQTFSSTVLLERYHNNYFYAIISAIASHKDDVQRPGENITTVSVRIRGVSVQTIPVALNFNAIRLRER
jgi:hypothetical protein